MAILLILLFDTQYSVFEKQNVILYCELKFHWPVNFHFLENHKSHELFPYQWSTCILGYKMSIEVGCKEQM